MKKQNPENKNKEMEINGITSYKMERVKIGNTDCMQKVLLQVLEREDFVNQQKEHLWFIGLDSDNYILCIDTVTIGSSTQAVVEPMNVFRNAIWKGATYGILAHNHPSGDVEPSEEDIDTTDRLYQCGLILNVPIKDHLVVSLKTYFSFFISKLMDKVERSIKYMPNYKLKERMLKEAEEIREKAMEAGIKKGMKVSKKEIAASMKKDGFDIKIISKYTGLTKKEIESI